MSTSLANAVNGAAAPRTNDHPTIARIQAQAAKFAEAMPNVMTPDRFMRIAIGAIRKNPKLLECDPLSLMGSLLVAAQLGFEVNTPSGHFYLIPRWNKKTQRMEADGQIGYKGWMDLLQRTDKVQSMTAEVVYEKDHFLYTLGDDPKIEHKPNLGERGRPIAYYVSVKLTNGGVFRKVLSRSDVEKYRARSKSPDAGPWISDYDAMALKTTFLRLVTWLPKSLEMKRADNYENTIEAQGSVRYIEKQGAIDYVIPEPEVESLPPPATDSGYAGDDDSSAEDAEIIDAEATVTRPVEETKPAPKTPRKRQPAAQAQPQQPAKAPAPASPSEEAPFDDQPAHDPRTRPRTEPAKPAPSPSSALAATVAQVEGWFSTVTAQNEEGGMPDLADRDTLMDWLWAKFVASGQATADVTHWYSRLNALAKLGGDTTGTIRLLDAALESVRKDYMGEPEQATETKPAESAAPQGETVGQKTAALDKWFEEWARAFDEAKVPAYAMPQNVAHQVYFRAMKTGLVSANAQDYRAKTKDLATIADTAAEVYSAIQPILDAMWNDFVKPEPGSNG